MTSEIKLALDKHRMWFGSYTRAGELKKVQVWCFPHSGNLEFLTAIDSLKAKRAKRNPYVICNLGSENGPAVEGTAQIITNKTEVWRGYRTYWNSHPLMMLLLALPMRGWIKSGRQILVRVRPEDPGILQ